MYPKHHFCFELRCMGTRTLAFIFLLRARTEANEPSGLKLNSIFLTSCNVGTYFINDGSVAFNRLTYKDDAGNTLLGAGGTLNITANSNNYISGNFFATLISGSGVPSQLTGNFTNMPVR
jgi:hypothetical protein